MTEIVLVLAGVMLLVVIGPPVVLGLQGHWRDRRLSRRLEAQRLAGAAVPLLTGRHLLDLDPGVPPALLATNVVRCLDATRLSLTTLRELVGGELHLLNGALRLARDEATERLRAEAIARGFDAVINVRYATSQILTTAIEVMAYGTGVRRRRG